MPDRGPIIVEHIRPRRARDLLAGMRIRKKLIILHTIFSLTLALVLALALSPAAKRIVDEAEFHEARLALSLALNRLAERRAIAAAGQGPFDPAPILEAVNKELPAGVRVGAGPLDRAGLPDALGPLTSEGAPEAGTARLPGSVPAVVSVDTKLGVGVVATAMLEGARTQVARLFILVTLAVLAVYALIAVALEVLVLPRQVYRPIRTLLRADAAALEGDDQASIIPERLIPADELGEIMRSRNRALLALRDRERELAQADRLASLGLMSAGLAHEINTPLAVVKGLVERMEERPAHALEPDERALLLRVVRRLEGLSESLLDFARVRAPQTTPTTLATLADEAWTLVGFDRDARRVEFVNAIERAVVVECDADRMTQVFVNILRNAADALADRPEPRITAASRSVVLAGNPAVAIAITDNGPGLAPPLLDRLFEPFASTRLDARGTGLGLAVSMGIVREHAGLLRAENRRDAHGAVFEIVLPLSAPLASPHPPVHPAPAPPYTSPP